MLEKINSSSEYEKTMQKGWADVAADGIHYSIYKHSLHAFNVELATARQTFFSNLINSNLNNTHNIFATVERLTNPPSQIPSKMLSNSQCNEFTSNQIKSNQITFIVTSPQHKCLGEWNSYERAPDSAKNNNSNNLHMDSTYLQTVQKTMCKIHIHILSTHSVL